MLRLGEAAPNRRGARGEGQGSPEVADALLEEIGIAGHRARAPEPPKIERPNALWVQEVEGSQSGFPCVDLTALDQGLGAGEGAGRCDAHARMYAPALLAGRGVGLEGVSRIAEGSESITVLLIEDMRGAPGELRCANPAGRSR